MELDEIIAEDRIINSHDFSHAVLYHRDLSLRLWINEETTKRLPYDGNTKGYSHSFIEGHMGMGGRICIAFSSSACMHEVAALKNQTNLDFIVF